MAHDDLQKTIETAWDARDGISFDTKGPVREAVDTALDLLDSGSVRVAEKKDGTWTVNQWLKKAVLLSFRLNDMETISGGPAGSFYWDKVQPKFAGWTADGFSQGRVPRAARRHRAPFGLHRSRRRAAAVLRQSRRLRRQRDHGRHLGDRRQLRSDRQELSYFGRRRHRRSARAAAGRAVVIEDNCFIGARAEVAEGVEVGEGSVLSMGVYLGASTTIIDRTTGEKFFGKVPPYSVIVSGSMPGKPLPNGEPGPNLYCAVIVKRVDEKTRSKTSINELLRD